MTRTQTYIIPHQQERKKTVVFNTPLHSKRIARIWASVSYPAQSVKIAAPAERFSFQDTISMHVNREEILKNFLLRWLCSGCYSKGNQTLPGRSFSLPVGVQARGSEVVIEIDSDKPVSIVLEFDDLEPAERPEYLYHIHQLTTILSDYFLSYDNRAKVIFETPGIADAFFFDYDIDFTPGMVLNNPYIRGGLPPEDVTFLASRMYWFPLNTENGIMREWSDSHFPASDFEIKNQLEYEFIKRLLSMDYFEVEGFYRWDQYCMQSWALIDTNKPPQKAFFPLPGNTSRTLKFSVVSFTPYYSGGWLDNNTFPLTYVCPPGLNPPVGAITSNYITNPVIHICTRYKNKR